jgi:hypothetical protein
MVKNNEPPTHATSNLGIWLVEKVNGNTIKESTKKVTKTEIYL